MSYRGSVNGGSIFFIGASRDCIASSPSTRFSVNGSNYEVLQRNICMYELLAATKVSRSQV
ncbi:MAG: hypothetical protein QOJ51_6695 [Acidobacteriaceae bacterium]|jgi:hypothetical protein|nr:hypothetical protein [Acidobacteriaceae bacterium]